MKYCVLIKVSKNKVSFWYQIEGASHAALSKSEENEIPLFFYVNGNDFIFGEFARKLYLNGDPNAFGKYFEIVKDPSKYFTIYGNPKPVKQLLYIGVEQYLSHFLNSVPFKSESIESYRPGFPLRFIFGSDLEENEKLLVETMFKEAGYNNIERVSYFSAFFETLAFNGVMNKDIPVILLSGIDNNLFIELFKENYNNSLASKVLEGCGSDPRIKIVAEMILEDILIRNPFLTFNKSSEIIQLMPLVQHAVEINVPIIWGTITLSDGTSCYFKIKQRDLNERLLYHTHEEQINKVIEQLLKENAVSIKDVVLLLNGSEMNTGYFTERLQKKINRVKGVPSNIENETLKLIFKKIADGDYEVSGGPLQIPLPDANNNIGKPPVPPDAGTKIDKPPIPPVPRVNLKPPVPPINNANNKNNNVNDYNKLIGTIALTSTDLSPSGKIEIDGKIYNALAQSGKIVKGKKVKIINVLDSLFTVKEVLLVPPLPPVKK